MRKEREVREEREERGEKEKEEGKDKEGEEKRKEECKTQGFVHDINTSHRYIHIQHRTHISKHPRTHLFEF